MSNRDLWREIAASNWGREFVAGGIGGIAGVFAGYPLDTVRIRQQQSAGESAFAIFRHAVAKEGVYSLYRGMFAPLATVTFQNAIAFQTYASLSRALDRNRGTNDPPSLRAVALGGIGTGATQSLLLSPVELIKIRLQLQNQNRTGPLEETRSIFRAQGLRGIYRGLGVTILRDAPSHGVYFWSYEYMRELLHPGCRKTAEESMTTMVVAGGMAGVASWICCYPLDVVKTRIQARSTSPYYGILECFETSVRQEGYRVLWRGLGAAVARAFVVNGAVFAAYETALRCIYE